ncbi:MAG TPA: TauD/TfdA family dioxygenase [Blastocatellia bacterium]|nr:TauD/TfdA family dioxygenase [Blastocatellia bacterium]
MASQSNVEEKCGLPGLISARDLGGQVNSCAALMEWVREHFGQVMERLRRDGAILFRGFSIEGAADFDRLASLFCPARGAYLGGNSPRTKVQGGVFTATEYERSVKISLHNEASYSRQMPRLILFYCEVAPVDRGQTPLADCRNILRRIAPEVRARFARQRIKYINNLHSGYGFGRSWQRVFQTEDKKQVEQWLEDNGYEYSWKSDGGLRTSIVAEAIMKHPETNEEVWANQAEQWHLSSLPPQTRKDLLAAFKTEENLPHHASFADGAPLMETDLEHIRQAIDEQERVFQWTERDVLLCDNYLVAHGRQPFTGERRILVTMG